MRFSNSVAGSSFGSCGTSSPHAIKGLSLGKPASAAATPAAKVGRTVLGEPLPVAEFEKGIAAPCMA